MNEWSELIYPGLVILKVFWMGTSLMMKSIYRGGFTLLTLLVGFTVGPD